MDERRTERERQRAGRHALVGLLVTLHSKDRTPAPPGKDADPQESLWDFKGRGRSLAVIGVRRFRVGRHEQAHYTGSLPWLAP